MTTLYFKIRNFEEFQHYSQRHPPWIRLYYRLLHDRRFFRLDDREKFVVVGLFLLASQYENRLPMDSEWIERELSLRRTPDWEAILNSEFIIPIDCDASALLASCKRGAPQSSTDSSEQIIQKAEAEILSNSPKPANPSGPVPGASSDQRPASVDATLGEKQRSAKKRLLEASAIFKYWNSQAATMHHRAMNGQERSISQALLTYSQTEIVRAIERYSQVRANRDGKYRVLYAWTLGEFLTRRGGYNLVRFNAEDWEAPFLKSTSDDFWSKYEAEDGK